MKHNVRNRPVSGPLTVKNERGDLIASAHIVFDRLWKNERRRGSARATAYTWLAEQLGIRSEECHFTLMDAATLRKAIGLCRKVDSVHLRCRSQNRENIKRASGW